MATITYSPDELVAIADRIRGFTATIRTYMAQNSVPMPFGNSTPSNTSDMTVHPGSAEYSPAKLLAGRVEGFATSYGQSLSFMLNVLDKLERDTRHAAKTMKEGSALASTKVSEFERQFKLTLTAMGVSS